MSETAKPLPKVEMQQQLRSPWTHSICDECWYRKNPGRIPLRMIGPKPAQKCCFCSKPHRSGIYIREHPADMECNGVHEKTA